MRVLRSFGGFNSRFALPRPTVFQATQSAMVTFSASPSTEKNRVALGKEGAVSLLNAYYNHKFLKRRSQDVALERISAACAAYVLTA